MTPEDARAQLSAYLDGELDPAARRQVEAALERHPALAAELEELRRTRELVRSLPRRRAPEGFAERVTAALGEPQRPAARLWPHWRPAVLAAAACLVVGLLVVLTLAPEGRRQSRAPEATGPALTETAPGREREELDRAEERKRPAYRDVELPDEAAARIQDKVIEGEPAPPAPAAPERPAAARRPVEKPAQEMVEGRPAAGTRRAPSGAGRTAVKAKKARPRPEAKREDQAPRHVRSTAEGYTLGEQARAEDVVGALAARIERREVPEPHRATPAREPKPRKLAKEQDRRVHEIRYDDLRRCLERLTAALEETDAAYAIQPQGSGRFVVETLVTEPQARRVLGRLAGQRAEGPPAPRGVAAGKDVESAERRVHLVIRFRRADQAPR